MGVRCWSLLPGPAWSWRGGKEQGCGQCSGWGQDAHVPLGMPVTPTELVTLRMFVPLGGEGALPTQRCGGHICTEGWGVLERRSLHPTHGTPAPCCPCTELQHPALGHPPCRVLSPTGVPSPQDDYHKLLTKYAEAENTIDQLRLGARVGGGSACLGGFPSLLPLLEVMCCAFLLFLLPGSCG